MSNLERKVDALMRLCVAETEEDRAEALAMARDLLSADAQEAPAVHREMDSAIRDILLDIGVPDHILGHRYLVSAITIVAEDPLAVKAVTGFLYPKVAEEHGTTWSKVERSIRNAIECAWDRGDPDVLVKYFGNTVSSQKGSPTNSEFIARIANVVRGQVEG